MKKEFAFTIKEVKENLIVAVGEAFARELKATATNTLVSYVKMKDYLGTTEDDLIPEKLDYITEEDFISARVNHDGRYVVTYFATDGLTFSVTDDDYDELVTRFVNYFINIYKA